MILVVNIRGGDVRMGVMEEIRRRINKIKRERWGRSKIRSLRRAIVIRGLSRGDCYSVSGAYVGCWRSGASAVGEALEAGRQRYAYIMWR